MFHDLGASSLNFTMAKATDFQRVFSVAIKLELKARTSATIIATGIKRSDFIFSATAYVAACGGISSQTALARSRSEHKSSVRNGAGKVDKGKRKREAARNCLAARVDATRRTKASRCKIQAASEFTTEILDMLFS
jgi:hypothetical protein